MKNRLNGLLFWLCCLALPCAAAPALKIYAMESPPVSFSDGGRATGLVVEVAREIQRRVGSDDPIDIVPWARANSVAGVEPNVVVLSIVRTAERERTLRFVGPIFQTEMWGYVLRSRVDELKAQDPGWHRLRAGGRRGVSICGLRRMKSCWAQSARLDMRRRMWCP